MSRLEKLVRIVHSVHFKILISFAFVILSGTVLLKLPVSIQEGAVLTWFDSLFIATSAVCVTGLTPVILADVFTPAGFFFIALLVQIGGLSFATFAAAFLLFLRRKASSTMIVESYGVKTRKWARLVKITMGITFSVEALGTLILFFFYQPYTSTLLESLGQAAFTSVSAFNNAGFDAFGTSMVGFNDHAGILITVASLIVLGGLGFLVYADLLDNRGRKLSIQTKVVVVTTVFLIIAGTLGFFLTGEMDLVNSFFQSVTARTAGFESVPQAEHTFISVIRQSSPVAFKRRLSSESIFKAFAVFMISIMIVCASSLVIMGLEEDKDPLFIIFEVVSAYATVGLSCALTPTLGIASRALLILLMFIGRVGPLTIAGLVAHKKERLNYLEENINIG